MGLFKKISRIKWLVSMLLVVTLITNVVPITPLLRVQAATTHSVSNGRVNISAGDGDYIITGTTTTGTADMAVITVQSGYKGQVTLDNVNITLSTAYASAMEVQGDARVTIVLKGKTNLSSGPYRAGLGVPAGATAIIEGDGYLTAKGGTNAAGIGAGANGTVGSLGSTGASGTNAGGNGGTGGVGYNAGTIIIKDGVISTVGGANSPGIGGGSGTTGGAGGTGGISGTQYGGAGGTGGTGGVGGNGGNTIIMGGTITATGTTAIGGGRGGNGGDGGTGGTSSSGNAYKGLGGNAAAGGRGGNTGNIIMVGGKLTGSTNVINASGGSAGAIGTGRTNGAAGAAGAAGTAGTVFALTDTVNYYFFGTNVIQNKLRTTDYRAAVNIYADFKNNAAVKTILDASGLDSAKLIMGVTPGTDGATTAIIDRNFYSNLATTVSTSFFTDAKSLAGDLTYQEQARTVAQLNAYSDISFATEATLTYNGNGHTGGTLEAPTSKTKGTSFKLAAPLTRTGYTWAGWNTKQDGTGTSFEANATIPYPFEVSTTLYAKWIANSYTLSYNANGGAGTPPIASSNSYDSKVVLESADSLTKNGLLFEAWNTKADGSGDMYAAGAAYKMGLDTILYAQWKEIKHNVSFETNGGTAVAELKDIADYSTILNPETIKTGHTFTGWFKNAALTSQWDFSTDKVTEDITLYAGWTADSYLIRYNANGGTGSIKNITAAYGSTVVVKGKETLEKAGNIFAGWSLVKNGSLTYKPNDEFTMAAAELILYAVWTPAPNVYTVSFKSNEGSQVADLAGISNGAAIVSPETTKTGHSFVGWFKDAALTNQWDFTLDKVTGNTTLYAKWSINSYKVKYNGNGNTFGSVANVSRLYNANVYVSDQGDLDKTGYVFDGWGIAKNGNTTYKPYDVFTMGAEDITLYAIWIPAGSVKTVTFETNGGSTVNHITNIVSGTIISAPETTKTGYSFTGWFKESSLTNQWNFTTDKVTSSMTLYAGWTPLASKYTVTFEVNGGSEVPPITNVADQTSITAPVTEKAGAIFTGWFKDVSLTNKWDFGTDKVTSNTTLYAGWSVNSYLLKYNANGATSGSVKNETVDSGSSTIIKDSGNLENANFTFGGWSTKKNGGTIYQPGDILVMGDSEMILYAVWIPLP